jgi:nucleoside-diphosphate-sugar epimerase
MTSVTILGCGYVGTAMAQRWQQAGLSVTATTTSPERLPELSAIADRALILRGNDASGLTTALQGQSTLLLSIGAKRGTPYRDTYLETAQTLAAIVPQLPELRQIIYTGSYVVYGDHQGQWVTETSPTRPNTPNAEVLVATEALLLGLMTLTRKICILRLGGIWGPGRELEKIFKNAAGTKRPGDGSDMSNWIHRDDILGAIAHAQRLQLSGIFNLVNDTPMPSKILLDGICERHGLAPITWDPSQPSARAYNVKVSNQKLKDTGYHFHHPNTLE